ncbi:hypothetical protein SAMN04487969_11498 [Paenibacillus algorifonticola]|uniref:Uncharacterized protein n=1 Tax=Paenibacillus algorifonticola TaxID=684063 RepID=A0A1I2G320_9BACL|nr:hypothetical protein SAMN04487969_11498 [Paenibacillus algorifonticola]
MATQYEGPKNKKRPDFRTPFLYDLPYYITGNAKRPLVSWVSVRCLLDWVPFTV